MTILLIYFHDMTYLLRAKLCTSGGIKVNCNVFIP